MPTRSILLALTACALSACVGDGPDPGVRAFLDDPTGFAAVVEGGAGPGTVTGAALDGDSLVIGYAYPGPEGPRAGTMSGIVTGPEFVGVYDTLGPGTHFRGPVRLTFSGGGAAEGVWNDGEGTVELVRPRRQDPAARRTP